jgi:hypothetical protein
MHSEPCALDARIPRNDAPPSSNNSLTSRQHSHAIVQTKLQYLCGRFRSFLEGLSGGAPSDGCVS